MLKNIISDEQQALLIDLIKKSETIVLTCHQNPDGDALGSCLAWAEGLRAVYGEAPQVVVPDRYPD